MYKGGRILSFGISSMSRVGSSEFSALFWQTQKNKSMSKMMDFLKISLRHTIFNFCFLFCASLWMMNGGGTMRRLGISSMNAVEFSSPREFVLQKPKKFYQFHQRRIPHFFVFFNSLGIKAGGSKRWCGISSLNILSSDSVEGSRWKLNICEVCEWQS